MQCLRVAGCDDVGAGGPRRIRRTDRQWLPTVRPIQTVADQRSHPVCCGEPVAHDEPDAAFDDDDDERCSDHRGVAAERQGLRRPVERRCEPGKHAVLALHVVSSGCDVAVRWTTNDEVPLVERDAAGEVGVSAAELGDGRGAIEAGDVGQEPGFEAGPVEVVAFSDRDDVGGRCAHRFTST